MSSFFIRSAYGKLKTIAASGGLLSSLLGIGLGVYDVISGTKVVGALIIVVSGFGTLNAIFNFIDIKGWLEMKKSIEDLNKLRLEYEKTLDDYREEREKFEKENSKFAEENERLAGNAERFEHTSVALEEQNVKLKDTVGQYQLQLQKIQMLAEQREEELRKITKEREGLVAVTEEQRENLRKAVETNQQFEVELAMQQEIRRRLEEQVSQISKLSKTYEEQNIAFQNMIEQDKEHIVDAERMIGSLEAQLAKFKLMYESMKQLVNVITEAETDMKNLLGEDIEKLNQSVADIDSAVDGMTEVTLKMTNAYKNRTAEDFRRFDLDHDGTLSEREFLIAMGVDKETPTNNTENIV